MHKNYLFLVLTFFLVSRSVFADLGPKPSMGFQFVLAEGVETSAVYTYGWIEEDEEIGKYAKLMLCEEKTCSTGGALGRYGPQSFECSISSEKHLSCVAMAYSFRPYSQLIVRFNDKIRVSNIFSTKGELNRSYTVTVFQDGMRVEPGSPAQDAKRVPVINPLPEHMNEPLPKRPVWNGEKPEDVPVPEESVWIQLSKNFHKILWTVFIETLFISFVFRKSPHRLGASVAWSLITLATVVSFHLFYIVFHRRYVLDTDRAFLMTLLSELVIVVVEAAIFKKFMHPAVYKGKNLLKISAGANLISYFPEIFLILIYFVAIIMELIT